MVATPTKSRRTFQKKAEPEQNDRWYSSLPLDVMWGIYARQSTQAQLIKNTESTEMQTDDLIAWLVEKGIQDGQWQLFDADLGVSGTLRIDQRTGLQELVERIRADEIKAVLVYQISRLFRVIDRLFSHLRQTHDFDVFRQWIAEVVQKQASLLETITQQLAEIDRQQEAILDEKLAIRTHISQQVREALSLDPTANADELRTRFEEEAAREFERLRKRSAKLAAMEEALRAKMPTEEENEEVRTAKTFADFQTELEKLAEVWHLKPFKEKKVFVNLLVKKTVLSVAATHWVRLDIHWTHPAWESETLYIYRRRGLLVRWTEEDRAIIHSQYETVDRETLLSLLPHKSWNAIKKEAGRLALKRSPQPALTIDEFTTWSDWQFCHERGIAPNTRDTICEQLS